MNTKNQKKGLSLSFRKINYCLALFIMLFGIYSCSKENNVVNQVVHNNAEKSTETTEVLKMKKIIFHYKGLVYESKMKVNQDNKYEYENMPKEIINFFADTTNESDSTKIGNVSHYLIYDDYIDAYLFDKEEEHLSAFTFENADINRKKGQNEAFCKTYGAAFLATLNGAGTGFWSLNSNSLIRTITNLTWKTFDFGSVGWNINAYGNSISWVGNAENDRIDAVWLNRMPGSERVHYMGCEHINWGGNRIYISLVSNKPGGDYLILNNLPMKFSWWPWSFGWKYWNDNISSYEMFQTNVKLYNNQI